MKKELNGQKLLRHIRRRALSIVLSAALVVTMLPADISRASTVADSADVPSKEAAKGVETTKASSDVKETVNTDSTKAENSAVEVESNTTKTEDTIKTTSAAGNTVTEGISGNEVSGADKVVGTKPGSVKTADGVPEGYTASAPVDSAGLNTFYYYQNDSTDGTMKAGTLYIKGTGTAKNASSSPSWNAYINEIQTIVIETEEIGDSLFSSRHRNLRTIELRDGVKSIGKSAFTGCCYVTHIDIPATVTSIGSNAFYSNSINSASANPPMYLKDVAIRCTGEEFTLGDNFALGNDNESHINYYVASADNAVAKAIKAQYEGQEEKTYSIKTLSEYDAIEEKELSISAEDVYLQEAITITVNKNTTGVDEGSLQYSVRNAGATLWTEQKDAEGNPLKVFTTPGTYDIYAIAEGTDTTFTTISPIASFEVKSAIDWEVTGDDGNKTLTIKPIAGKATAYMPDYGSSDSPWYSERANITEIIIKPGISNIGAYAFYAQKLLAKVTLEDESNEWVIGDNAFGGSATAACVLTNEEAQKVLNKASELGADVFARNKTITSLTIPENVKKVKGNAFERCTGLVEVNIEAASEAFTDSATAFASCSALTTVNVPSTWTEIPGYFLYNISSLQNFTIPENVTTIGQSAFTGTGLTEVKLPNSVTTVGGYAFQNCTALATLTLSDKLETISMAAFNGCSLLETITIPNSVKEIGNSAFSGCSLLEPFDLPEGIVTIGSSALPTGYTTLTLPTTLTGTLDISGMKALTELTVNCACEVTAYSASNPVPLEKLTIGEKVETIPENAYRGIKTLTDVTFPEAEASSLTTIGDNAFKLVEGITGDLVLSSSVTYVGESAFEGSSLTSVVMEAPEAEVGPEDYYTVCEDAFTSDTIEYIELKSPAILRFPNVNTSAVSGGITGRTKDRASNPELPDLVVKVHAADLQGTDAAGGTYRGSMINTKYASPEHDTIIFTQEKAYRTQLAQFAANKDRNRALLKLEVEGERVTETGLHYIVTDTEDVELKDQTITITSYTGEATEVTIPEEIEVSYGETDTGEELGETTYSHKVTTIGTGAFATSKITKITLPETVTTIEDSAFQSCEKLTTINLDKVEHIGDRAFRGANVKNPAFDSLITIGESVFINDTSSSGRNQGDILLPDTVTSIGAGAFQDMGPKAGETYSNITIPANDSYTRIENNTFNSVVAKMVTIPANITEIGQRAFVASNVTLLKIEGENVANITTIPLCKYVYIENKDSVSYKTFEAAGYMIISGVDDAKAQLESRIKEAEDALAGIVRSDYQESYLENLEAGIKDAKALLESADAEATEYLEAAENLVDLTADSFKKVSTEVAQKSLEDLLEDIDANKDRDDYTEESWNNLLEVMDRVSSYLASEDCVNSELEKLLEELQAAVDALEKKPAAPTPGTGDKPDTGTVKPGTGDKPGTGTPGTGTPEKVTVKKVTLKKLSSPKKKTLKVQWKKVSGATGYQIKIGTNSKMTKNKKVINIKKGKTVKKTIKKLKSKKKYYVKVRAYKTVNGKKNYGAWSKVKKIKVK